MFKITIIKLIVNNYSHQLINFKTTLTIYLYIYILNNLSLWDIFVH